MIEMRRYVCERPKRSKRPCARASPRAVRPSDAASSARGPEERTGSPKASTAAVSRVPPLDPRRTRSMASALSPHRVREKPGPIDLAGCIPRQLAQVHESRGHFVLRDPRLQEVAQLPVGGRGPDISDADLPPSPVARRAHPG